MRRISGPKAASQKIFRSSLVLINTMYFIQLVFLCERCCQCRQESGLDGKDSLGINYIEWIQQ